MGGFATRLFVLILLVTTAPVMVRAQSLPTAGEADDDWRFAITPYAFLPVSTTGTSTIAGYESNVDLSLSDIFKNLNFAASVHGEAWKGDFGVMLDLYYVSLGADTSIALTSPGPGYADVTVKSKQGWASLIGTYRFYDSSFRSLSGAERRYAFDAGAGVKLNTLNQTVDINGQVNTGSVQPFSASPGGTEVWVEPAIHLRGMAEIGEDWRFVTRAEFSGFGVGGDKLQWLLTTGFDYQAWEQVSMKLGWQFYGINYATDRSNGRFAYDVFETGPFLGATFTF